MASPGRSKLKTLAKTKLQQTSELDKDNADKDIEKGPEPKDEILSKEISRKSATEITGKKSKFNKEKGVDDDKLEYDPEDDVWALDEGKPSIGRKYARSVMDAFRPVLYFCIFFGLFPLAPRRKKDGTYEIDFSWFSYAAILFLITAAIVVSSTLWMLISFMCISINFPEHPSTSGKKTGDIFRSEEIFVIKRNVVTVIVMIASFVHLMICMIAVFHRRDFIAKQLVYWTEVVELLQLDIGHNVAIRLWRQLIIIMIASGIIIAVYALDVSPALAGSGSTFYIVMTHIVDPLSLWHEKIGVYKLVCAIYLLYCMFAGYLYILWFFFNCRILTNILRIWNNRFQYCLHKHILERPNEQETKDARLGARASDRTSRANLFHDHLVIFNLLEGVNTQFEVIMESFYLSTMIMIVFEAYGLVHACFYEEYCNRREDVIPFFLLLALQMFLYITVTLEAAGVADEARHVLDIVRRKGMMTSRVDAELWFMLSMRLSFGGHEDVGIIGAGFIYVTKSFMLGAISAIASHFIIFYQFQVPYSQTEAADSNFPLLNIGEITRQTEGRSASEC